MMSSLDARRERFRRDPPSIRMGNIASELARIGRRVAAGDPDDRIIDGLRSVAAMMDWMGDDATYELAEMQRERCRWRRIWPNAAARPLLILRTRWMSEEVLNASGLLGS